MALDRDERRKIRRMGCAICNKEFSACTSFFSEKRILERLRRNFNRCSACGRYVCDDCFVVSDGYSIVGLCRDCSNKNN